MPEVIVNKVGDVKIFGKGQLGGKGFGLVKINEADIPQAHKLRTRILSTVFYERFLEDGFRFGEQDLKTFRSILAGLGDIPISVRSSATNEACMTPGGDPSVHAGENTSFMLPNNHRNPDTRFHQLVQAISHIYQEFAHKQPPGSQEKMAIVINPIPGVSLNSDAGLVYFPMVSGVANSFFPYALKTQESEEGFARLAFGHGYATVLDDFPVISMATIRDPLPVRLLSEGQKYFYAIDMSQNKDLKGEELETMKRLHIRFADYKVTKRLGRYKGSVTLEDLIQGDRFGFRSSLLDIMETVAARITSHFQIEFVFNLDRDDQGGGTGTFHVVQLTRLPVMTFEEVRIPTSARHTYLTIRNLQGHGIKRGIRHAIVISPFRYRKDHHDAVIRKLSTLAAAFRERYEGYIILVPGRLGTTNRDWGIQVEFKDIGQPAGIFEFGVDIAGRPEPSHDTTTTGGIYGSHFLYMIQGGHDEEQKRIQTRMFGTQGTHFLTNLMSNQVIYGYIAPLEDWIDPWFFSPAEGNDAVYVQSFPQPVTIFADSINQICSILAEEG
jgi:hypothetical protein